MSYLRSPFYVWAGFDGIHIWRREPDATYDEYVHSCDFTTGVRLPADAFDAICLMRVAEIDASCNRRKYERSALEKYGGNFGSAALYARLGITPPWQQPGEPDRTD